MSIFVTKTFLPPINEYQKLLKKVWDTHILTNRGELVVELEDKLKHFLKISSNILIMNNGTIPLQIALKLIGKKGEIITTPFSYVATTASIIWENCKPVFVDIDKDHLTIDESLIEAAITKNTTCILATHVFGNPCNVQLIEKIATKYNLKVIYDAAHSFGVKYDSKSIFDYGDVSTCSFHATKSFHTGEGGAIFCNNEELMHRIYYTHNFGHNGSLEFHGLGINGKISELQAAMGLAILPYVDKCKEHRKQVVNFYDSNLKNSISKIKIREKTEWNYSYYPIIFESEAQLLKVEKTLNNNDIFPRRYFYPSLNTLNYLNYNSMTVSETISKTILCLPLYAQIEEKNVERITHLINDII